MAESAHDAQSAAGAAPPAKSGGMLVKIIALLFVCAVIFAECLIAYLYLGRSGEAVANASEEEASVDESGDGGHTKEKKDAAKGGHGKKPESAGHRGEKESPSGDVVEVDLEKFTVTAHQPTSSTTMRIEFHLYGMVAAKDQEEFERLVKANQHRLREQVLVIVRRAEATDLADPGLGLIKRQILEKTNALLGKPLLQAVVVSDFSYIEQ